MYESAEAGFDSGDGYNYLILNDSFMNGIVNIGKSSNVNVLGKYIFRVDSNMTSNSLTNTSFFENSIASLSKNSTYINSSSTLDLVDSTFTQLANEFTTSSLNSNTIESTTFAQLTNELINNITRENTAFNSSFASLTYENTEKMDQDYTKYSIFFIQNNFTENSFQTSNLVNVTLSQPIETTSVITTVISTDLIRSNEYIYNQSSQMTTIKSMAMNFTEKTAIILESAS